MLRMLAYALAIAAIFQSPVLAGEFYSPERNTPMRESIMDAAREPIEGAIGPPVIFEVEHVRTNGQWAFLHAVPKRPDGRNIDYSGTIYQEAIDADAFGGTAAILLKRQGDDWAVVTWGLGFSDVIWDSWDEEFGAPEALWP